MKRLFVFADFDWLEKTELVGELTMDNIRGGETYGFKFEPSWLKKHGGVSLSDDINNYVGMQYTQPGRDIFGCFSDSLPDRWGRTLVLRREQILAAEEKRPVRRLSSMDYLLGIDDHFRNHGFLLTPKGWTLSPAYDLNPTLSRDQSLLINAYTTESDLDILLDSCNDYMISSKVASSIIDKVKESMSSWSSLATSIGLSLSEQNMFKDRFDIS